MKRLIHPCMSWLLLLIGLLLLGTACGPLAAPDIVAVTPLPQESLSTTAAATQILSTVAAPTNTSTNPVATEEQRATPTPLSVALPQGSAAAIALATDVALQPTIANPLTFDESPIALTFDEFYNGFNLRTGLVLSDKLLSLDGKEVVIEGYMAPPLKPELDWFVLTRIRLEFCPFCSSTADWPDDIALVYVLDKPILTTIQPLRVQGRIEIGSVVDAETGMVSLVRIYAEQIETLASSTRPSVAMVAARPKGYQ